MSQPRVAIVCDWLTGIGGAERVLLELHKLYPEAPIFTSQYNPSKIDWFADADVRTGWLQKLPSSLKKFLPVLRAWYFSHLDLSDYDLVLSSSGAEAKGVKTGPNTVHICYCHSPTHYYWIRYDEYLAHPGFPRGLNWLARLGLKLLVGPLKRWDKRAAQQPNFMVANSSHTQAMIKKYYRRDSTVIFPPVDLARLKTSEHTLHVSDRHGFVAVGRQTPYKRIDLAVAACSELKLPLVVIGNGPEHQKLVKMAGRSVTFLTQATDEEVISHMRTAEGFLFPTNVEDFGVTAVEALATGTPVIAYQKGGPLDYVIPGKTGLFFDKLTVASLTAAIQKFDPAKYDSPQIEVFAQQFSTSVFKEKLIYFINSSVKSQ